MNKFGVCDLSVLPVRKSPISKSEMVTQLLYGEIFTIINFQEKWSEICITHDNYTGWVNNTQIRFIEKSTYNSLKKNKLIYCLDVNGCVTNKNGVKFSIPIGSVVSSCILLNTIYQGKKGILTKSKIIKMAKLFLESPYLWGGRITNGIDCSGFSQLIYRICGLEIDRDARQQALQGKKIDSSKINPGNLAFFGNSIKEITHVGIILNKNEIIHAFGKIRIDIINNRGIMNLDSRKLTHKIVEFRKY